MNRLMIAALALAALMAAVEAIPADKYTTRFDNINLQEILSNERLLKQYIQCLLDDNENRCTADGKELRKNIPDALLNECSRCSEKQREGTEIVIRHLTEKRRSDWGKLLQKYDPQGIYNQRYEAQREKLGIKA